MKSLFLLFLFLILSETATSLVTTPRPTTKSTPSTSSTSSSPPPQSNQKYIHYVLIGIAILIAIVAAAYTIRVCIVNKTHPTEPYHWKDPDGTAGSAPAGSVPEKVKVEPKDQNDEAKETKVTKGELNAQKPVASVESKDGKTISVSMKGVRETGHVEGTQPSENEEKMKEELPLSTASSDSYSLKNPNPTERSKMENKTPEKSPATRTAVRGSSQSRTADRSRRRCVRVTTADLKGHTAKTADEKTVEDKTMEKTNDTPESGATGKSGDEPKGGTPTENILKDAAAKAHEKSESGKAKAGTESAVKIAGKAKQHAGHKKPEPAKSTSKSSTSKDGSKKKGMLASAASGVKALLGSKESKKKRKK